ncbi:MAG: SusC/RagA family TonB-linked outer membrane protein [Proteiniphilum sp.]|uniref:SusC/RagA family TonB-linked outer membrane protein n=1 Tax=Proteiniphilum sp. TaxID=1926877 RepID=UPI0009263260|nr:SusC/RagA family TonB-linked outer membrane protein [Proteiniphilum sp.]MEA5127458.1 SusC/RagA family TonB-linked outer membrane protein [Proteiniphilum sp.]OJV86507.1 MAG: SusC/RagA family TonB-linked outer membrane protein [Bacteroidia bacterium 44-10]
MKRKLVLFLTLFFVGMGVINAQTQVRGTVVDEVGDPVIGASIIIKGTSQGTVTDIEGNFSLSVSATAKTLVISYVGMITQEVAIQPTLHVILQASAHSLDEVVVTALGVSREKKSLGYAIQEVDAGELTKAGALSLTGSLSGKVAGVQINQFGGSVGASSRIAIRGNSSLNPDQQPLIVVDGIPIANDTRRSGDNTYNGVDYGSGLNDINPEDIESISVLKGGSAALYGMRAGNGVILITTKSGRNTNGISVSYDMSITMDRVANIPKLQNSYGQGHDGDEWHWKNGVNLDEDSPYYRQTYASYLTYQDYAVQHGFDYSTGVFTGYDESWGPRLDVGLKISQYDSNGEYVDWVSRPNNVKDFFQTGLSMNHMISVQAKSEKIITRASLSFRDQVGTVPNTDQKRYSGQINTDIKLNDYISYDMSASYTRTQSDNLITQGYGNNPINSLVTWSGRQINMKTLKKNWDQKDEVGNYTYYNWIDDYHMNPYFSVNENTNSYQRDRIFGKSSLYYTPFDWLKFEGRVGLDYYNAQTFEKHYFDRGDWPNGGFLQETTRNTELNMDFIASVNKTFGDFNLYGIIGANYRDVTWETHALGATALTVPGVYTLANKSGDATATMDHSHIRSNSVYANASLGWKSQLYLDASARNDWSSTIREDFFYPSVSVSWLPTTSFENIKGDVLSFLKLRAGIAQIGSATSAYRNSYYYYAENSSFNGVAQMYKSYTYPNFDLKPESITTWEVGTEVGLLDDRLHLDLAYYQKKTKDQILSVTTSNVVGFSSMLVNAGRIDNKGIEIQLRGDILRSRDGLNWTSTLNFAKDKSKIVDLYPGLNAYRIGWTWGISTMARIGSPWGNLEGTGYQRITEDDVKGNLATSDQIGAIKMNANGRPMTASASVIGNVTPDFLMGWRQDFTYKNLSFGFLLDLRIGGDIWSQTMSHSYSAGVAYETAKDGIRERFIVGGKDVQTNERFVVQDGSGKWVENTIETDAYTWFNSYGTSETYVFDGSFLKLREFYLSYDVPKSVLNRTKYFNKATVSLIGTNLALLWVDSSNTLRLDPEVGGVSSDSRGIGFEQASTPGSRSFGIKLGLTF